MIAWLSVIGIGADGLVSLGPMARARLAGAALVVGGARHLALLGDHPAERWAWASPLADTVAALEARRGTPVAVLASGDPMWFGIGAALVERFPGEVEVLPVPGAFSLAAAVLGWPLAEVQCLTVHGRPLSVVLRHLAPAARLLVLAEGPETAGALCRLLTEVGWGDSHVSVLEHLGADMVRLEGTAAHWPHGPTRALATIAVVARPDAGTPCYSRVPGLPDDAFEHDGMLTKQAVRAATLAALAPQPGERLWDVGAGSGSIAIEWLRAVPRTSAIAIERDEGRLARLTANAQRLGTPEITAVHGAAPAVLAGLAPPDAIFIGGGLSTAGVWDACWRALRAGGRLVANAVTLEGEAVLAAAARAPGAELVRLQVQRAVPVGPHLGWRPAMPVTQIRLVKP
ncbi:MAG: precorrin-6y C5,15-methyltransferase (decarboxylating) subunit CbiE [Alphaproteobacteria bacterium]|nr:precorrin-6y C5,15-methyltransferase (decarboxylating) subunit CbiE [Alphaproteobacteria bacterium]